jgi:Tol biopolymer transport system component
MRLIKSVGGLLLVLIGGVGIVVVLARALQGQAACLLYDTRDDQGGDIRSIAPMNGRQFVYDRAPAQLPALPFNSDVSDDGKHQIYLTGPKSGPYSLFIDPKPLKRYDGGGRCFTTQGCWIGEVPPHSNARLVKSDIQQPFIASWLDDKRLVYSSPLANQRQTLIVESLDGLTKSTLPMTFAQRDDISLTVMQTPLVFVVNHTDIYVWYLSDGRVVSFPVVLNNPSSYPRLSPQGKYLSFTDQSKLVVLSTETRARFDLSLPTRYPQVDLSWSPDERYFVLEFNDFSSGPQRTLYRLDGTKILDIGKDKGFWSKDNRIYSFVQETDQGSDLIALHLDTGRAETLLRDIKWNFGQLANGKLVVVWQENGGLTLGLLNLETGVKHMLSSNISQIGDVKILNNGQTILYMLAHDNYINTEVVDENGNNHILLVSGTAIIQPTVINAGKSLLYFAGHDATFNLETINLDGTEHRTLATGLEAIGSMNTWENNQRLDETHDSPDLITFAGRRNDNWTAEIAIPQTGVHRVLADNLAAVDDLIPDKELSGISFYWQKANIGYGADGFTLDGKRVYHVTFPDTDYTGGYYDFHYLRSSNERVIAVMAHTPLSLYLMAADGSWQKSIRSNIGNSYSQAWSLDGNQFAFVETDDSGADISISIVDENGNDIRRITGVGKAGRLDWNHCEY